MRIDVQEAAVRTATVEIKSLTVSGKQVTQAVFKQLLSEPVTDDHESFRGLPWGRVNYHPDRCADDAGHLHIVWQKGDELRRAYVIEPKHPERWWSEAATDWVDELILGGFTPEPKPYPYRLRNEIVLNTGFGKVVVDLSPEAERWIYNEHDRPRLESVIRERLSVGGDGSMSFYDEVRADVLTQQAVFADKVRRWNELCALPQLFIAV